MGRVKTYSTRCKEPGCPEVGFHEYTRVSEPRVTDWRCARHRHPEEVLSLDQPDCSATLTVEQKDYGRFWNDGERTRSGFAYGPGFRAFAKDFEPGTRLVITARIEAGGDRAR